MAASSESSKKKIKKAMEKGDMELAKIHAESAVRQKNTARNFERLATRVEAVQHRVQQAVAANTMNTNMTKVTKGLAAVLNAMEPEKIAAKLDEFEQQNETLDVRVDFMDGAISNTVAGATPEDEVSNLLQEVGDTVGLDVSAALEDDLPNAVPRGNVEQTAEDVKDQA